MKKHNLAEFLKSKSFYALLCVGALAIVVITMVGLNQTSGKDKSNDLVDLNEPNVSEVADGEGDSQEPINETDTNNTTSSTTANNEKGNSQDEVAKGIPDNQGKIDKAVTDGSLLEFDIYDEPQGVAVNEGIDPEDTSTEVGAKTESGDTETTKADDEANQDKPVKQEEPVKQEQPAKTEQTVKPKQEETQSVMNTETLHFKAENGLLWPVSGNILMKYSVDRVIYHATLEQFKCNPAVIIDAEVGTPVLSAANGIVTSITQEDESGLTITASIGSGYSLVYGQLKDITVEVGDTVEEGKVLGIIATPSKYFSVEGSNLYFQVLKDEETVNPMSLLRDESY